MSTTSATVYVRDVEVTVDFEDIKNLHIAVYPPAGRVRVAAPVGMEVDAVRVAVVRRWPWVERKRAGFRDAPRQSEREMVDGESHYVWGRRYRLRVVERSGRSSLAVSGGRLVLQIRPGVDGRGRREALERWKRAELRRAALPVIAQWQGALEVDLPGWGMRRMKTKWGTLSRSNGTMWLNPELAKKHPDCLEYIVVHELIHLLEPNHGPRYVALMTKHLPDWERRRDLLDSAPLIEEPWGPEETAG